MIVRVHEFRFAKGRLAPVSSVFDEYAGDPLGEEHVEFLLDLVMPAVSQDGIAHYQDDQGNELELFQVTIITVILRH